MSDIIEKSKKIDPKKVEEFKKIELIDRDIYSFSQDGKKWIFKLSSSKDGNSYDFEYCYNEIIASYVARFLKITNIEVHLAYIEKSFLNHKYNKYGNMLEDYNVNGYRSHLGTELLENYYKYLKENNKLANYGLENCPEDSNIVMMNNLKTINDAFLYYLKENDIEDYEDKTEMLMDEMARRFCFDYLIMQADRHAENWVFLESKEKKIVLGKVFDNELAFDKTFESQMKVNNFNEKNEDSLINFINSSSKYKDMFIQMYNTLTPENMQMIINMVEQQEGIIPSIIYKNELIDKYTKHYKEIGKILKQLEPGGGGRGR